MSLYHTDVDSSYPSQVQLIETTEFVVGGDSGIDNRALKLLANRNAYLKKNKALLFRGSGAPSAGTVSGVTLDSNNVNNTYYIDEDTKSMYKLTSISPATWTTIVKNNITSSAPTVTDDSASGYDVFSKWIDTSDDNKLYFCKDATASSAIWEEAGGTGSILTSQTIDTAVGIGDPIFFSITKETVEDCNVADWSDGAQVTTSIESTNVIQDYALIIEKAGGGATADMSKVLPVQLDFTSKNLNFYLYIGDSTILDKFITTDSLIIRYGNDASNYYQWTVDKSALSVGWNYINGLNTSNKDSENGSVTISQMDYLFFAITTNNPTDTWDETGSDKVIMDYWFLGYNEEWQRSGSNKPSPQGMYIGSNRVILKGYTDSFSDLIPGQVYWMDDNGDKTTKSGYAYNGTKLGSSLSNTEFIVDIDIEGSNTTRTIIIGGFPGDVKGYMPGGYDSGYVNIIDDLIYSDETSQAITATLDVARQSTSCYSKDDKGYAAGGQAAAYRNEIDELLFSDESSSGITATLPYLVGQAAAISSTERGYTVGGTSGTRKNTAVALIFSSETTLTLSATLDTAQSEPTGISSEIYGYIMGGENPTWANDIERLVFSTNTIGAISATLDTAKYSTTGVSGFVKGYVMGGYISGPANTTVIEDIIFSDESSQAITETLDTAKRSGTGVSSTGKGYCMGGRVAVEINVIEDLIFSNETSQSISATLDATKQDGGSSGIQD